MSTYLRHLAEAEARRVRRERIRAQSRVVACSVARYPVARRPTAQTFYEDWGAPTTALPDAP